MLVEALKQPPKVVRETLKAVDTFFYDNKIVRDFGIATVFWGIAGMLIGVIVAFQLARPR